MAARFTSYRLTVDNVIAYSIKHSEVIFSHWMPGLIPYTCIIHTESHRYIVNEQTVRCRWTEKLSPQGLSSATVWAPWGSFYYNSSMQTYSYYFPVSVLTVLICVNSLQSLIKQEGLYILPEAAATWNLTDRSVTARTLISQTITSPRDDQGWTRNVTFSSYLLFVCIQHVMCHTIQYGFCLQDRFVFTSRTRLRTSVIFLDIFWITLA